MTKIIRIFIYLIIVHISGEGRIRALADQAIKNLPLCVINQFQNSSLSFSSLNTIYQEIIESIRITPDSSLTIDFIHETEWMALSRVQSGGWNEWISSVTITRLCYPAERIFKSGVCLWLKLSSANTLWRVSGIMSNIFGSVALNTLTPTIESRPIDSATDASNPAASINNTIPAIAQFLLHHWDDDAIPLSSLLFRLSYCQLLSLT